MPEEVQTEKVETQVEKTEPEVTKAEGKKLSVAELQDELERAKRSLANKAEEAQRVHEKLERFEQEELKRKEAEMSELEKLQAQIVEKESALANVQTELEQMKLNNQKREVAEEVGLPAAFVSRIQGATPEEMKADAQQLLDAMPKGTAKMSITSPGKDAMQISETEAEKRKRLLSYRTITTR